MILEYWLGVHKTGGGTNGGDAPSPGGETTFGRSYCVKIKIKIAKNINWIFLYFYF